MSEIRVREVTSAEMELAHTEAINTILRHVQAWQRSGIPPNEVSGAILTIAAHLAGELVGRVHANHPRGKFLATKAMGPFGRLVMEQVVDYIDNHSEKLPAKQ